MFEVLNSHLIFSENLSLCFCLCFSCQLKRRPVSALKGRSSEPLIAIVTLSNSQFLTSVNKRYINCFKMAPNQKHEARNKVSILKKFTKCQVKDTELKAYFDFKKFVRIKVSSCDINLSNTEFKVKRSTQLSQLKQYYAENVKVCVKALKFTYNGRTISDFATPNSLKMQNESMIYVNFCFISSRFTPQSTVFSIIQLLTY